MMDEIRAKVAKIKELVEDVNASTYKVVGVQTDQGEFNVIASYDMEADRYNYTVATDSFTEIKLLCEIPAPVILALAELIKHVDEVAPTPTAPTPMTVAQMSDKAHSVMTREHDVEEFNLK